MKGKTLTSEEFGDDYLEQQIRRHKNPEDYIGLKFGFPRLDKITGGARKKEFIVVAGAQKSGKTTMATHWTLNFANQLQEDEVILMVSLEMSHEGLGARVFANLAEINVTKFRDYALEDRDWSGFKEAVIELKKKPILWNVGAYNMSGINAIIKELEKDGKKVRTVVVDYFQLMSGDSNLAKRYEQLERISLELKQLAMTHDTTVVAVAQQTREALKSLKRQRDPNTIAGTQALARDADMMLIILPYIDSEDGEEVPHLRNIWLALSRNSASGMDFKAAFSGEYARMGEAALDEEHQPRPEPRAYQTEF